jgi:hypothetical protein
LPHSEMGTVATRSGGHVNQLRHMAQLKIAAPSIGARRRTSWLNRHRQSTAGSSERQLACRFRVPTFREWRDNHM